MRRIIPDGQRRKISQAEIARKAEVSEGTVSSAMKILDGIFLVRHFVGKGRGNGYEIELLPPHEFRPRMALSTPTKGSKSDPCNRSFTEGITTPETPHEKGTKSDPSIFSLHAHEQQQQTGSPPDQEISTPVQPDRAGPEPPAELAPETVAALAEAGAHPKLIARVAAINPACTPADVAKALLDAEEKAAKDGRWHTPKGLGLDCLANNQQIVVPRSRPETPAEPKRRKSLDPGALTPEKIAAYKGTPGLIVGDEPELLEDAGADEPTVEIEADLLDQAEEARREPPPPPSIPFLLQGAVNMGGQPRNPAEQAFLIERFEAGDDARAAVGALHNRRAEELSRLKARDEALIAEVAQLLGGASPSPDERRIIASRLSLKDSPEEITAALRRKREQSAVPKARSN
jgi:hypothetical protein